MATLIVSAAFDKSIDDTVAPPLVALSVYDVVRQQRVVYYVGDVIENEAIDGCAYKIRPLPDLLREFWAGASQYDVFVTYGGRAKLWPYLYHLSAKLSIRPTVQISRERYLSQQTFPYHIDLFDEFSFYKELQPWPILSQLTDFFGMDYEEMGDKEITELLVKEKSRQIAMYTVQCNSATSQLYDIWSQYYAAPKFLDVID